MGKRQEAKEKKAAAAVQAKLNVADKAARATAHPGAYNGNDSVGRGALLKQAWIGFRNRGGYNFAAMEELGPLTQSGCRSTSVTLNASQRQSTVLVVKVIVRLEDDGSLRKQDVHSRAALIEAAAECLRVPATSLFLSGARSGGKEADLSVSVLSEAKAAEVTASALDPGTLAKALHDEGLGAVAVFLPESIEGEISEFTSPSTPPKRSGDPSKLRNSVTKKSMTARRAKELEVQRIERRNSMKDKINKPKLKTKKEREEEETEAQRLKMKADFAKRISNRVEGKWRQSSGTLVSPGQLKNRIPAGSRDKIPGTAI